MLFLRWLLFAISFGFLGVAAIIVFYDVYLAFELNRILQRRERPPEKPAAGQTTAANAPAPTEGAAPAPFASATPPPPPARPSFRLPPRTPGPRRAIRWSAAAKLVIAAALCTLLGKSLLVVPDGHAAVRISQISGVRPGTLYSGTHLIMPLIERAQLYDIRDNVYSTAASENLRDKGLEVLTVEAPEGLSVGLAVTVRYRLDPAASITSRPISPQPIDQQIVAPVVTSIFRDLGPSYAVRDVFSTKREEFHQRAAQAITARLAEDQSSSRKCCCAKCSSRRIRARAARLAPQRAGRRSHHRRPRASSRKK